MNKNEQSAFKGKTGIKRLVNAAAYSADGFKVAWEFESAFRQVCLLAVCGIGLMFFLPMSVTARGLVVFAHFFSVAIELLNSAVEAAVDHTSLEQHPLAKRAKDLGSAAQVVSLLNMIVIWIIVLVY